MGPIDDDTGDLARQVEDLYERIGELSAGDKEATVTVETAIDLLDRGEARVAEVDAAGQVVVHEWLKKAILLLFRLRAIETTEVGPFEYADRLPLKRDFVSAGVRVVPGASARWGSYLARGVVLMPSYVNIGAYVGEQTMVDTWATVASCAQIGARVHLSGGVGIGGVLEPPNAVPVVVEDDAFIGSRCMVTGGARVGEGAVLGAGSFLDPSIPVIDSETGEELSRGAVPPWCVAIRASRRRTYPGGEFFIPCVLVIKRLTEGDRHDKAQLNEVLREHGREHMTADLLMATADLVAIPSVSRHEAALADHIEVRLAGCRWLAVERVGDNVVARTTLGRHRRVVIAGHLDTVPPADNETPRIEGDTLYGLGAADMKGGIAVMLDLATAVESPSIDVTWCFYRGEEIEHTENGLVHLFAERPDLLVGDAAVLCEPTACLIEAGCQGSIRARIVLAGKRAHSARPHLGRNAIHRMAPLLERVTRWEPRTVMLDGCEYTERLQVVAIEGGVAPNVVPDHAAALFNFRFAPDRSEAEATDYLRGLFADLLETDQGDAFEVLDVSGAAPPGLRDPLLAVLLEATGRPARAKLGWTDVATFSERGVPATNFGPGDPDLAHQADEHVDRASLDRARSSLGALIGA